MAHDLGTIFNPASPQAQSIYDLMLVTTAILSVIFLIVTVGVAYMAWRFRGRPDEPGEPPQVYGHKGLEMTWTIIPFLIVTLLTVLMTQTMLATHPEPAAGRQPDVVVIGHQWWWEVRYPSGVITANELHVPVGQKTLVQLETADVIHDFWVPALGPKEDTVPGQPDFLWLEPSQAGVYDGACAEFCGNQHAWMRTRVVAQSPADFQAWLQAESAPAAVGPKAHDGQALFATLTCINCHRGPGMATGPTAGPDLTHLGDRQSLAAGVLPNTRVTLAAWLQAPQAIKPQCNMPDFHLTDAQVSALVDYLEPVAPGSGAGTAAVEPQ